MTDSSWTRRDFIRRTAMGAALVGSGSVVLGACSKTNPSGDGGGSVLDQLKSQGTITVGFAGEAPYGYKEGGELVGEAPAVHEAVWKAAGIDKMEGKQVDFGQLIPGLNAQRFDTVAAGMFILPDRCAKAAFSDPVYVAPEAFLVPKGNPKNISDFESVAKTGITLGVLQGASEGIYAKQSGVAGSKITEVAGQRDGLAALKAGRIDAFGLTTISLNNILKENPGVPYEIVPEGGFTPVIKGDKKVGAGGAVFRKEDDTLRKEFNKQLAKLRESGELLELIKPYGFGENTIPPEDVTTKKLCASS